MERNDIDGLSEDDSEYEEPSSEEEYALEDEDDEEMSDDISESDSMEDEDEDEDKEDEGIEDGDEKSGSEPEVTSEDHAVVEKLNEPEWKVEEVIQPTTTTTQTQTQTPPITPEQPSTSRKRPLPTDDDNEEEEPTTDLPLQHTISPIRQITDSLVSQENDPSHLYQLHLLQHQPPVEKINKLIEEQSNKRRRIDDEETGRKGWSSVAATVGKYTIAGAVGGIATLVGLVWAEKQGF